MNARSILLLALPLLFACASGGGAEPGAASESRPRSSAHPITREDVLETRLSDAYSVVQRLRPRWIRRRGPDVPGAAQDVVVYVDANPRGYAESLRGISAGSVFRIVFVDPITARVRYGPGHEQGVIVVTLGPR